MTAIVPTAAVTTGSSPRRRSGPAEAAIVVLTFPRAQFAIIWLSIAALRLICTGYMISMGRVYLALAQPEMAYYANFLTPYSAILFVPAAWAYFAFGAAHSYQLVQTLATSVGSRTLLFGNHQMLTYNCHRRPPRFAVLHHFRNWYHKLAVYRFLLDRQGLFGAESPYFQVMFILRELFEMASQSVQVFTASFFISRPWINHLYVSMFVINSCSTPIIEHFTHHSPALERVLCLAADMILDSVMSIALPGILVVPYVMLYDTTTMSFPPAELYSAVWFSRLVSENRQVFAYNGVNLAMMLIPHMSIYSCLNTIQSLIRPKALRRPKSEQSNGTSTKLRQPKSLSDSDQQSQAQLKNPLNRQEHLKSAGPPASLTQATRPSLFRSSLSQRILQMQSRRLNRRKTMLLHVVFCCWGLAVLTLHLMATYKAANASHIPPGCMQSIRPWFATKYACSVYKYNCKEQATLTPTEDSLEFMDEQSVVALIFANCPEFEMPTTIRKFSHLLGIDVWNSTIKAWSSEAALSSTLHPNMVYLVIFGVNMTGLPTGVLEDLPRNLADVELSHCNLTTLPSDLDRRWAQVDTLYLEFCKFKEYPDVLTRMPVDFLSLVGNKIDQLPADFMRDHYCLWLSNNPLKRLPDESGDMSTLALLALDNTDLSDFPSWVAEPSSPQIYAYGTPFCTSQTGDTLASKGGEATSLTCADTNPNINGLYPIDVAKSFWS